MSETEEKDGKIVLTRVVLFFPFRGGKTLVRDLHIACISLESAECPTVADRCQVITRAMICQLREGNEKLVFGTGSPRYLLG